MTENKVDIESYLILVALLGVLAYKFIEDNPNFIQNLIKIAIYFTLITATIIVIYFFIKIPEFRVFVKPLLRYSVYTLLLLNIVVSFALIKLGVNRQSIISISITICVLLFLIEKLRLWVFDTIETNKIQKELQKIEENKFKKIFDFDPGKAGIDRILKHLEHIESLKSSKLYPQYKEKINEHIEQVKQALIIKKKEKRLQTLEEQEEEILDRIKEAQESERKQKQTEEQRIKELKEDFLEKHEDTIYLYLKSLTIQKRQWLKELGFRKAQQWDLIHQELRDIMIKPRSNESVSHAFVTANISDYLKAKKNIDSVMLYQTKMPDIVFKIKDKNWAIEVETGTMLKKKPKEFKQKIEMLNEKFEKNWFIVVTSKKLVQKYRQYGTVLERSKVINFVDDLVSFSPP